MKFYNSVIKNGNLFIYRPNNNYLPNLCILVDDNEAILFYPNALFSQDYLIEKINQDIGLNKIKYIVIHNLEGIPYIFDDVFAAYGLKPNFIIRNTLANQVNGFLTSTKIYNIREHNYELTLSSGNIIKFYPTSFLSTAGSFISYDCNTQTLFPHYLFSDVNNDIIAFHKKYLPSSDFIKPILQTLSKLDIKLVIPEFGMYHSEKQYQKYMNILSSYDFFNHNVVSMQVKAKYNYLDLCNQIINRLKTLFGDEDVAAIFNNTDLDIDNELVRLTDKNSANYQLWHRLFEIIYVKKGITWLAVVEAIVDKISDVYGIDKPVIYDSAVAHTKKQMDELNERNKQLQEKNQILQDNLQTTSDKLIRCPITHAYNDTFFKEFITDEVVNKKKDNITLLFIGIDRIEYINSSHSKAEGDLTLKNMAYLLNQIIDQDQVLFKRNGPGFILYLQEPELIVKEIADTILINVKNADIFIEQITASIALVKIDEFNDYEKEQPEFISNLIYKGESQLRIAQANGGNRIVYDEVVEFHNEKPKILIVDNDDIVYDALTNTLNREEFDILIVNNGVDALDIVNSKKIDIIITNQNVAKLDGFRIKSILNDSIATQDIPFFIITYNKNREIIQRANQLNINLVLERPLIIEEVIGHIKKIFR